MQVYRFWLTISGTAMHLLKQSSRYFHTSCETILHTVSTETCSLSQACDKNMSEISERCEGDEGEMWRRWVTEMVRVLLSLEAMRDFAGKNDMAWRDKRWLRIKHMFLWPFELAQILSFTKAYGKCYSKKATIVSSWLALHILHSHCYLRLGGLHICRVADDERLVYKLLITLLPLFFCTKELERHSSKSFLSTMMHDPARFSEPNTRTHVWVAQSVDCARAVQSTDCPRKARIHALRSAIHGLSPILGLRTTYILLLLFLAQYLYHHAQHMKIHETATINFTLYLKWTEPRECLPSLPNGRYELLILSHYNNTRI